MASKKPRKAKPSVGEVWEVCRMEGDLLTVLVLELGPLYDKGYREVKCLTLDELDSNLVPGSTPTFSNGTFNAPNRRIA